MLERTKVWFGEKKEKGSKWFEKNKNAIIFGVGLGCASSVVVLMIGGKIFENKEVGILFSPIQNRDGSWDEKFGVETYGVNRFGKVNRGVRVRFDQNQADWIADTAHKVVKDINEHNEK